MNTVYEIQKAREMGYTHDRQQFLDATGWSKATLGRKIDTDKGDLAEGEHFVYTRGRTKPTPMFSDAALTVAGVQIAELYADPNNSDSGSIQRVSSPHVSTGHSHSTQLTTKETIQPERTHEKLTKNSLPQATAEAYVMLLLGKPFLTLDEAANLTGLTKAFLETTSELIGGRRLVRRSRIDTL